MMTKEKRQRRKYPEDLKRDAVALATEQGNSIAEGARCARQRDERAVSEWKTKRWLTLKNAAKEGRVMVFVDESSPSE